MARKAEQKMLCNLCGSVIPKDKVVEFQSKFKAQGDQIRKDVEKVFNDKLKAKDEQNQLLLEQQKGLFEDFKADLEVAKDKDFERFKKEQERAFAEKTKDMDKTIKELTKKVSDFEDEKEKLEADLKKKYDANLAKAIEEKAGEINGLNDELKKLRQNYDSDIQKKVDDAVRKKDDEINDIKRKSKDEKEEEIGKLLKKIRELEEKTPTELGDEGQRDVLYILRRAFQQDQIDETKHGKLGSDIFHKIMDGVDVAGLIVYEVKNVSTWSNDFIEQVKKQKTEHKANYAILVTTAFPYKEKIIAEKEGILIVHPSKIAIIVNPIRDFILEIRRTKLSGDEVEEKTRLLQDYLTSPEYGNQISDVFRSIQKWQQVREKEKLGHYKHWEDEELLNKEISDRTAKIYTKVKSIIESKLERAQVTVTEKRKKRRN